MDGFVVLLGSVIVGLAIALAVVSTRYVRLDREVDAVLDRTTLHSGDGSRPRSLYRNVRGLERDLASARQETSLLRLAVDSTDLGMVIADRERGVVFTNHAADDVMKGRLGDAVARTRVLQLIERVTFTGVGEDLEFDLYTPHRRIVNLTAIPILDGSSAVDGAVVYIIDLTDRHRVEAMRKDFVANASHELKTPLGALSLLAETLVQAEDDEMRIRLAQRLQSEAARMAHVIDDVLILAETESLGAEHTPQSFAAIVDEAVTSLEELAREKGISIVDEGTDEAMVAADRQQLVSAISNLLHNAVTYTAIKGESGTVRYRSSTDNGTVCLSVADTGIGIPQRYVDRVFERFFCVDRSLSREAGGTGLGLSIVRNVALAHGGTITVDSKVGVGSTFTLCLPVLPEETP